MAPRRFGQLEATPTVTAGGIRLGGVKLQHQAAASSCDIGQSQRNAALATPPKLPGGHRVLAARKLGVRPFDAKAGAGMAEKYESNLREQPHVLLWGARSKARIIEEMLRESQAGKVSLIFDPTLSAPTFDTDAQFICDIDKLNDRIRSVSHFVVCIGAEHGYARLKTAQHLERAGLTVITLQHERSFVEPTARIGKGCQVMPGAVIHKFSLIGDHTIINTNATVDHECIIGQGVHIMGSAAVAGKVEIGDYATIGTNATILPHIKIGEGAFVGAGAVVTKDVQPYTVVTGMPARVVRKTELQCQEDLLRKLASRPFA